MEIQPATVAQLVNYRGRRVLITDDVGNVARDLHDIDPGYRLRYLPETGENGISVVYRSDGNLEQLITTMQGPPDQRLVRRIREIRHSSYDLVKELVKQDARAEREQAHREREAYGPAVEKLAWGLRKDLGAKNKSLPKANPRQRDGRASGR